MAEALPGYEIGGEIGRGACGIVLAGRHRELGRDVAIKRLPRILGADSELRARFLSEARLLGSLDHPHIVRIYDFVEADGVCALVMQLLEGGTVAERLRGGPLDPRAACAVVVATCSALHYAHGRGVLHRDIKPQNLMFSAEYVLKVTDFGIAKVIGDAAATVTRTGHLLGTPAFIAPEQVEGAEPGPAIDVYAAGVVLYVLLCGQLPFPPAEDPITELYQHVHRDPVALLDRNPDVPIALDGVTACALSRDPDARYPTAQDLAVAVSRAAAEEWGPAWARDTGVVLLGAPPAAETRPQPAHAAAGGPAARSGADLGDGLYVAGADRSLIGRLERELAVRRHADEVARVRALCRLAIELHLAGAPVERCRRLIAEAERAAGDDPAIELVVLYSALVATWSADDLRGRLAGARRLVAGARRCGDADMAFRGHRLNLRALLEVGDDAAADRELAALDAAAAQLDGAWHRWQAALCRATCALRDRRTDDAQRLMVEAFEHGRAVDADLARRCFDDQAARHRWLTRATREIVPGLREALESCPWLAVRRAMLAYALASLGRRTEAMVHFEHLASDGFASVPRDANWLMTMVLLSRTCARLEDRPRARILNAALGPYDERHAVTGDCTVTGGPVGVAVAGLAAVL